MNKYHQEVLEEIKKHASFAVKSVLHGSNYSGNQDVRYGINNSTKNLIAEQWASKHKNISVEEFQNLLNSLYAGESHEEKTIGGYLLSYFNKHRTEINPQILDKWLDHLIGWEQIDSLCQSTFTEKDLLNKWQNWEKIIKRFVVDKNISKRRSSLVLLTWSVDHNEDQRFADLAIENIEKLKKEKDILITKAISWLLRSMIKNHRKRVEDYLKSNQTSLPKIAVRETTRKLTTGKK